MHGAGCTFCAHTGYPGVYELPTLTGDIRAMVITGAGRDVIRDYCRNPIIPNNAVIDTPSIASRDTFARRVREERRVVIRVLDQRAR